MGHQRGSLGETMTVMGVENDHGAGGGKCPGLDPDPDRQPGIFFGIIR